MSNQDFSNRELYRDRSAKVESRGRINVPLHHAQNLQSVFGSNARQQPRDEIRPISTRNISIDRAAVSPTVRSPRPATKLAPVAVKPATGPKLDLIVRPVSGIAKKPEFHEKPKEKSSAEKAEKQTQKIEENTQKVETKTKRLQTRRLRAQAKIDRKTARLDKLNKLNKKKPIDKTPSVTTSKNASSQSEFANQILASAAETIPNNLDNGLASPSIDTNGAAALPLDTKHFGPRITFQIKINHKKVLSFLKFVAITGVLGVSGYLAWDTWFTNKPINYSFANSAGAVSIDDTNPFNIDPTSVSNQAWGAHTAPADEPRYLYLPSINVKARVDHVGINSSGNIDSPKNANDAAWYDGSAKPTQDGQVFINGHKSYSSSYNAAFDNLDKLKAGEQIAIETGNGERITYKVVSIEIVATDKVDMNKTLNVPTGAKRGLTLMTYAGKYNYREQSAEQRVIVYAIQK